MQYRSADTCRTPLRFDSIQRMTRVENSILVVDDDLASRRLLARTLTAAGYTCAEAESGEKALELVRKQPPCLLLLDYDMPGLNGADVSKQIRADPSPAIAQIPTIMLTGHVGEIAFSSRQRRKRNPNGNHAHSRSRFSQHSGRPLLHDRDVRGA